jgi:hypothetical protein
MTELNARLIAKASGTSGESPQAADLEVAEIAVNTADGKFFTKHTDGTIKVISGTGGGGGAVDSVNTQTGVVSLGIQDMNDLALLSPTQTPGYYWGNYLNSNQNWDYAGSGKYGLKASSVEGKDWILTVCSFDASGSDRDSDWATVEVGDQITLSEDGTAWHTFEVASVSRYDSDNYSGYVKPVYIIGIVEVSAGIPDLATWTGGFYTDPLHRADFQPLAEGDILQWNDTESKFKPAQLPTGGGIEEAPEDGTPYVRQDADWVSAPSGGGGAVDSVNGETGVVSLGIQDMDDFKLYLTSGGAVSFANKLTGAPSSNETLAPDTWKSLDSDSSGTFWIYLPKNATTQLLIGGTEVTIQLSTGVNFTATVDNNTTSAGEVHALRWESPHPPELAQVDDAPAGTSLTILSGVLPGAISIPLAEGDVLQWNAGQAAFMPEQLPEGFSGDYNDLVNTPTIPPAGIGEAPQDGKVYGRSDGAWTEVTGTGGDGGAVDSVNGETGVVSLGIQEMDDFELNELENPVTGGEWTTYSSNSISSGRWGFNTVSSKEYLLVGENDSSGEYYSDEFNGGGGKLWIQFAGTGGTADLSVVNGTFIISGGANGNYWSIGNSDNTPISQTLGYDGDTTRTVKIWFGDPSLTEEPLAEGDILQWNDTDQKFKPAQLPTGGGGAVDSVNGETGVVSLGIQDMDDFELNLPASVVGGSRVKVAAPDFPNTTNGFATENLLFLIDHVGASGVNEYESGRWISQIVIGSTIFVTDPGGNQFTTEVLGDPITDTASQYGPRTYFTTSTAFSGAMFALPTGTEISIGLGGFYGPGAPLLPLTQGDILQWNDADQKFKPAQPSEVGLGIEEAPEDGTPYVRQDADWVSAPSGGGGGTTDLDGLSDVTVSNPGDGQMIAYNSATSEWVGTESLIDWTVTAGDPHAASVTFLGTYDTTLTVGGVTPTIAGTVITTPGKFGNAATFDGSSRLQYGSFNAVDMPADFTIDFWVKVDDASDHGLITKRNQVGAGGGTWGIITGSGGWSFQDLQAISSFAGTTLTVGQWHHLAIVRSGTQLSTYTDGVLNNTANCITNFTTGEALRVGNWDTSGSRQLLGQIDDLRITPGVVRYTGASFTPPTAAADSVATLSGGLPLGNLSDVNLTAPADGDLLSYDSASSEWVPRTVGIQDMDDFELNLSPNATWSITATASHAGGMISGEGYVGSTSVNVSPIDASGVNRGSDLIAWTQTLSLPATITFEFGGTRYPATCTTTYEQTTSTGAYLPRMAFDFGGIDPFSGEKFIAEELNIVEFTSYLGSTNIPLAEGDILQWFDSEQKFKPAQIGGTVTSVNGETGVVSLGIQDMDDFELAAFGSVNFTNRVQDTVDILGPEYCRFNNFANTSGSNYFSWHSSLNTLDAMQVGDDITFSSPGLTDFVTTVSEDQEANNYLRVTGKFPQEFLDIPLGATSITISSSRLGVGFEPLYQGDILQWSDTDQRFKPAQLPEVINKVRLQVEVAASTDFADFQARIAAL